MFHKVHKRNRMSLEHYMLLVQIYMTIIPINAHLSFPIDSYYTTGGFVDGGDKDGVTADPVHVDTRAGLQVVQVYVSKFGDKINNIIL